MSSQFRRYDKPLGANVTPVSVFIVAVEAFFTANERGFAQKIAFGVAHAGVNGSKIEKMAFKIGLF